jgi:hypothetical protein
MPALAEKQGVAGREAAANQEPAVPRLARA